jgi:hypothetical protein
VDQLPCTEVDQLPCTTALEGSSLHSREVAKLPLASKEVDQQLHQAVVDQKPETSLAEQTCRILPLLPLLLWWLVDTWNLLRRLLGDVSANEAWLWRK